MEFLTEYGLFLAKTITFVIAVAVIISIAVASKMNKASPEKGHVEIINLSEKFDDIFDAVKYAVVDEKLIKQQEKNEKKERKAKLKAERKQAKALAKSGEVADEQLEKPRVFVANFEGDIKASATEELREAITAILSIARPIDEVVVRLESAGGMVHSYGLASSQLARITEKEIPLTVCVDKVAASGGYMMACVASKIVCAPFAIIGSIGVVAQLPNFHKLLKKHDIDYEMLTAGEYKRTLTMFGENTDKGRQKFVEELEDTHLLFKDFIQGHRPQVDVPAVATGEIWFGTRAIEQKLVDLLQTSDQYLLDRRADADIYEVNFVHKQSMAEKIGFNVEAGLERAFSSVLQKLNHKFFS